MLFKLLALPISLPAAGIKFCFQQLLNTAEHELTDDEPVKEQLLLLTLKLEEGEIGEDEFAEQEAVLHRRLREIRQYREQKGQAQLAAMRAAQQAKGVPVADSRGARVELSGEYGASTPPDTGR